MAALNLVSLKPDPAALPTLVRRESLQEHGKSPGRVHSSGWHLCSSLLLLASLDVLVVAALLAFGVFCFRH